MFLDDITNDNVTALTRRCWSDSGFQTRVSRNELESPAPGGRGPHACAAWARENQRRSITDYFYVLQVLK